MAAIDGQFPGRTFAPPLTLTGPTRRPRQMLDEQVCGGHASVHDAATADRLGLVGAPIEGPTHFSQFDPLALAGFGTEWFETGCISAHFSNMVVEREQVIATLADRAFVHLCGEVRRDRRRDGYGHGRSRPSDRAGRAPRPARRPR